MARSRRGPSPAVEAARRRTCYPDDQSSRCAPPSPPRGPSTDEVAVGTGSAALLMDAIPHACADHAARGGRLRALVRRLPARRPQRRRPLRRGGDRRAGHRRPGRLRRDVEALLGRGHRPHPGGRDRQPGQPDRRAPDGRRAATSRPAARARHPGGRRGLPPLRHRAGRLRDGPRARPRAPAGAGAAHLLQGLRPGGPADRGVTDPPSWSRPLDGRRPRFNVTAPAQAAAIASLADTDHLAATVDGTLAGRDGWRPGCARSGSRSPTGSATSSPSSSAPRRPVVASLRRPRHRGPSARAPTACTSRSGSPSAPPRRSTRCSRPPRGPGRGARAGAWAPLLARRRPAGRAAAGLQRR
jgi:hypothetical protein